MLLCSYEVHVQMRIFRKPINKYLYIPWLSAHPLSVKKAFVKAKLTQFTTIYSQEKYYIETTLLLYRNLYYRGYLSGILMS